ncbi:MAG TPA: pitrilysin family protein [Vicinamibacterales bacterium]|nr:pitrilysin family protein [Vicinamibacterales bacterium]
MTTRRFIFTIAAIGVATAGLVSARQAAPPQPSSKAVVMKGRAPVSTELLKIKLPRPAEADLPNGLHVMVLEDRRVPQVTFQLLIPGAGGYYDPADMSGVASVTAAMMREGTPSLSTLQISEKLESLASAVTVGTGTASIDATLSGSSLTENFDATFGLAADVLMNPTFPDAELTRYKERTRAGLIQQRTNPGFLASEMFSRVVYGNHPASRISITAPVLDKLARTMLVDLHRDRYVPDNAVLAIAGDISMSEARKVIDAKLAAWKKRGTAAPMVEDPPAIGPGKIYFVARPNSVQTNFIVGTQGINRTAPDYDIVSVMNQVLGGGPTGRLFIILREEKGYTYGAYSNFSATRFRGNWSASTEVRTDVTEPAFRDLMIQIARMRDEAVPEKEFQDKKRGMVASFALSLESPQAVLQNHITRWLYKLPADYWDRYPERVAAVTQAQVQEAARKYLSLGRLQIIAVGDPKIGDTLKQFGTVETYDTEGKIVGK